MPTLGFVRGGCGAPTPRPLLTQGGDPALAERASPLAPWLICATYVDSLLSPRFLAGARSRGPRPLTLPTRSESTRPSDGTLLGREEGCSCRSALDAPFCF